MENRTYYQPNNVDVIYENFGNEVVLINLKTGIYYSLTGTALSIWTFIEKRTFLEEIIRGFVENNNADRDGIEKEIKHFIAQLENEMLIIPFDKAQARDLPARSSGLDFADIQPFSPPVLEKYTDQQELLLLDPIHDVSDLGWPDKNRDMPDGN
jgi:hypothetical protein